MKYMLDTNIVVYAKNAKSDLVLKNLKKYKTNELCISSITLAVLEYGIFNSTKQAQNRLALIVFLSNIEVIYFDVLAARTYGEIRYNLKTKGKLIGANDLLIAAHAKSLGYTLVTNNTKEFERVEGLLIDNWMN